MDVLTRYILIFLISCSTLQLSAASLDVVISNVSSAKGNLIIALYNNANTFTKKGYEYKAAITKPTISITSYRFEHIVSGNYAAVSFHDENSNIKLDKRFGIPIEPFGFSNNAKAKFGPPKFSATMFKVTDKPKSIRIILNNY